MSFRSGGRGLLEVFPTRGSMAETYEWSGAEHRVLVQAGGVDAGRFTAWENDRVVGDWLRSVDHRDR